MARYLTPAKVALLALIHIYTAGEVPNSAIVPLLSFLVAHLLPVEALPAVRHAAAPQPASSPARNTSSREAADESPRIPGHGTPSIRDVERATCTLASSMPGRSIWDLFLKRLWQFDCSDTLDEFFSSLPDILVKTREERIQDRDDGVEEEPSDRVLLSRYSPLGVFVRRVSLEFTKLQFHDSMNLWKAFIKYRMPTYQAWGKRNPMEHQTTVDSNLFELGLDLDSPLARVMYGDLEDEDESPEMSAKDIERLLEFQISKMQSKGARVAPEMKDKLERIIMAGATVPSLFHYVRFLDSWRAGDHPSSFDHLHRYFDYTIQTRDRTFYQYALLNLSLLQADFGCHREAVSAVQETIAIGRETHDMNCLNFCMTWLYHFGKMFPEELKDIQNTGMLGSDKEALAFLQSKARETEMWGLLSTALLSEGKLEMANGGSIASTFESILKASYVSITKERRDSMGPQMMLQASLFGRLGLTHLTWSIYETFHECYAQFSLIEDDIRVTCRSAQLLSWIGRHDDATKQMNNIPTDKLQSLKHQQTWAFFMGLLKLRRQLHRDNLRAAQHILTQLEGASPPDPELLATLNLTKVELLMREGDYESALTTVDRLAQTIHQGNFDISTQINLLIIKARIFDKTGQPERGFSLAMRAASLAHRSRLLVALWDAIGTLCVILMSFREFTAAMELLESVMPQVLECEDRSLAGRTYSYLVDANMGLAGENRRDEVRMKEHLATAVECIDCAFAEYSAIEDVRGQCEMMAKKATVMHQSGDLVLANDYAAKYLDLKQRAVLERE